MEAQHPIHEPPSRSVLRERPPKQLRFRALSAGREGDLAAMKKYNLVDIDEALRNAELAINEYYTGDRRWAEGWLLKANRVNRPKITEKLTVERLYEILDYNPSTGEFRWKRRPNSNGSWNIRRAGQIAGTNFDQKGYRNIMVDGMRCYAHRLAWFYVYGEWPSRFIDHINRIRDDNRLVNLRLATSGENTRNSTKKIGKSGIRGLSIAASGNWIARISYEGKSHHLGVFADKKEARAAYVEAAKRLHGKFARTQ